MLENFARHPEELEQEEDVSGTSLLKAKAGCACRLPSWNELQPIICSRSKKPLLASSMPQGVSGVTRPRDWACTGQAATCRRPMLDTLSSCQCVRRFGKMRKEWVIFPRTAKRNTASPAYQCWRNGEEWATDLAKTGMAQAPIECLQTRTNAAA